MNGLVTSGSATTGAFVNSSFRQRIACSCFGFQINFRLPVRLFFNSWSGWAFSLKFLIRLLYCPATPRNESSSFLHVGTGNSLIFFTFSSVGLLHPFPILFPRNSISVTAKTHLSLWTLRLALCSALNTSSKWAMCCFTFSEKTIMSSR